MPRLVIDIETRSAADLRKVGSHVYAEHPTTEISHVGYKLDAGETRMWRPAQEPIPIDLYALLADPAVTLVAQNFEFERSLLLGPPGQRIHIPVDSLAPLDRWDCTAARAAAIGLPRSLEGAAAALGLPVQKDKEGHALMLRVCKPRRPRKDEDPNGLYWWDDEPRMARMDAYCARDVDAEYGLDKALPALIPAERAIWRLTTRMNEHGVLVDTGLLAAVASMVETATGWVDAALCEKTGGAVKAVSDAGALTRWLTDQGIDDHINPDNGKASVAKALVAAMIDNAELDPLIRSVLELRRDGGGSSAKKWKAIAQRLSSDGRARGAMVYCGASATGRWSSRGIQLQNLPRGGTIAGVLDAAEDLIAGAPAEWIAGVYGPPIIVASELLRPAFIAPPGKFLARGDYSQIEARVNPWLAGAEWKLDRFRSYDAGTGPDLYKVCAAGILCKPIEDITKAERQGTGKVPELALGFGGGAGALQNMAKVYRVTIPMHPRGEDGRPLHNVEAEPGCDEWIKQRWRRTNPEIVMFWHGLEHFALECMSRPFGDVVDVWTIDRSIDSRNPVLIHKTPLQFVRNSKALCMRLPSGRGLFYWTPRVRKAPTPWGERWSLFYRGEDSQTHQWKEWAAWGGLICENCLAGDTAVLTDTGVKRLDQIGATDRVWDGTAWVKHDGLINKGEQNVIDFSGVRLTPDHHVLTRRGMVACSDTTPSEAIGTFARHYRLPSSAFAGGGVSRLCLREGSQAGTVAVPVRLRRLQGHDREGFFRGLVSLLRLRDLTDEGRCLPGAYDITRDVPASRVWGLARYASAVSRLAARGLRQLRRARHSCLCTLAAVRGFLVGYGTYLPARFVAGADGQRRWLQPVELPVGNYAGAVREQADEHQNRHALGSNDSRESGRSSGDRANNALQPHTAGVAVRQAVHPARLSQPGLTTLVYDILNAGPRHRFAVIGAGARPFLVSNCVQAVARDVMRDAMLRMEEDGELPVLTVHDEGIVEIAASSPEEAAAFVARHMAVQPSWAPGLPIASDSSANRRYVKAD